MQQALGAFEDAGLIAFESEQIIPSQFLGGDPRAFLLAVHGISRNQSIVDLGQVTQESREGGDLVALIFDWHLGQGQP